MNTTNFISPLETVNIISIFSYVNTLSDFLFAENCLLKEDQYKHIPVVNGLYQYLYPYQYGELERQNRRLRLARKLINGTDLYGDKENENLNSHFINTLFNHIISSLVFRRFTNVYGFIAETIQMTEQDSLIPLYHHIKKMLVSLAFENVSGEDSKLDPLAVEKIFIEIIYPLFPEPKLFPVKVTSVDFIYAQAGNMFLRSGETEATLNENSAGTRDYQELVEIAHTIEQLVLAKKLNETVLKIFALPALINYVLKEKKELNLIKISDIINSPVHWRKAYRNLFTYLSDAFLSMQRVQNNNYQYEFYLSMSNYRNRTTIAREMIEINCPEVTDSDMETEINRYKNNPDTYTCRHVDYTDKKMNPLDDLNTLFQQEVNNVTQKYHTYEIESCRMLFGNEFIKSLDKANVIISKGLIRFYTDGFSALEAESIQLVKPSHDLLQFYYPDNDTYTYYALIRKGYNISLIDEKSNPISFREALGLESDQTFRYNYFPIVLKERNERFEVLLTKIATERSKLFGTNLKLKGSDETKKEWWINFGLSLIPFYTCVKDIRENNFKGAFEICPLNGLFILPIVGAVGAIGTKISMTAEKWILTLSETTLRTIAVRTSIRTILRNVGKAMLEEMGEFSGLFSMETFKDLGIALVRFIDPGFELMYSLGKGGLRSIRTVLAVIGRRHSISSQYLKLRLEGIQTAINEFPKKINTLSGKDVYVNSLTKNSAYGYKFIPLKNGQVAEIRTVYPAGREIPVVVRPRGDKIENQVSKIERTIYNEVDLEWEKIIGEDYFLDEEGLIVSGERRFGLAVSHGSDNVVEGGNFLTTAINSIKNKKNVLTEAVNFAVKKGKFSETVVRNELKKYAFPETGMMEMNFVREWMNSQELKVPVWSAQYKIVVVDLFNELKYKEVIENPEISVEEASKRIDELYLSTESENIKTELPLSSVLKDFKERKAYNYVTFEDYYALRYYGGSGYKKMAEDSHETRRMKNAIYRLAIRQSEDPDEKFAKILFRGESRITGAIEKELADKEFEFTRFTSVSTDIDTANTYSMKGTPENTRVFYELSFKNPIVRARVEHLFVLGEKETILLPGTKFHIDNIERSTELLESGIRQNLIKVKATHMDEIGTKIKRQQSVMKEIKKLMEKDTRYYYKEITDAVRN